MAPAKEKKVQCNDQRLLVFIFLLKSGSFLRDAFMSAGVARTTMLQVACLGVMLMRNTGEVIPTNIFLISLFVFGGSYSHIPVVWLPQN